MAQLSGLAHLDEVVRFTTSPESFLRHGEARPQGRARRPRPRSNAPVCFARMRLTFATKGVTNAAP
jgi:hypothetical protein